jgi:hypothetical protein
MRNHSALLSLVKLINKDDYTCLPSLAVCALMIAFWKQMGIEENQLKSLGMAGLLHDVGKITMPEAIMMPLLQIVAIKQVGHLLKPFVKWPNGKMDILTPRFFRHLFVQ